MHVAVAVWTVATIPIVLGAACLLGCAAWRKSGNLRLLDRCFMGSVLALAMSAGVAGTSYFVRMNNPYYNPNCRPPVFYPGDLVHVGVHEEIEPVQGRYSLDGVMVENCTARLANGAEIGWLPDEVSGRSDLWFDDLTNNRDRTPVSVTPSISLRIPRSEMLRGATLSCDVVGVLTWPMKSFLEVSKFSTVETDISTRVEVRVGDPSDWFFHKAVGDVTGFATWATIGIFLLVVPPCRRIQARAYAAMVDGG